jgi:predicted RNase H-like nuclease
VTRAAESVERRRHSAASLTTLRRFDHLESLADASPPLDVRASPRWEDLRRAVADAGSGAALDRAEDEIDAYVGAYVAAYYWTHGEARCRVVGDLEGGYIVTPVTPAQGACLDGPASVAFPIKGDTPGNQTASSSRACPFGG